jgi:hypothetical protein
MTEAKGKKTQEEIARIDKEIGRAHKGAAQQKAVSIPPRRTYE